MPGRKRRELRLLGFEKRLQHLAPFGIGGLGQLLLEAIDVSLGYESFHGGILPEA